MSTPIRRQYLELKQRYPDTILFFRLGDFYETFDEDARIAASELQITLTSKPMGKDVRVPLAGVPYHSIDGHVAKLVSRGYRVAICEQMADAADVKGLVPREVVRVITAGTVTADASLAPDEPNYLAAIAVRRGVTAVAITDITTGEVRVASGAEALAELARSAPAELLCEDPADVPAGISSHVGPRVALSDTAIATALASLFGDHGRESLLEGDAEAAALAHVILYLGETYRAALGAMTRVRRVPSAGILAVDQRTLRNLDVLPGSGRAGSLVRVLDRTRTPMGARLLRAWLTRPLRDPEALERRLDATGWAAGNPIIREQAQAVLRGIADIERLAGKIGARSSGPRDLDALRAGLRGALELGAVLERADLPPPLADARKGLALAVDHLVVLDEALADDPPSTFDEGGIIRGGFRGDIDSLHAMTRDARGFLLGLEGLERERTGIRSLKVGHNRVFGYYIEVSTANAALVPDHYQRRQTLVGAERYVTEELKEYESQLVGARERLIELEKQAFAGLVESLAANLPQLQSIAESLATLDVTLALGETAATRDYVRPTLTEGGPVVIRAGRHPVVEDALGPGRFVPNDCVLDAETQIVVLTGPNMSGKSTFLRQIALIALMAQAGSFVPADHAELPLFDRIFTRIGAQDDLAAGQSTFMVEMVETAQILHQATPASLVVLDEVGRGTSTFDGMAIARAVVEFLHNRKEVAARTLFATHYHELTALAGLLPRVHNAHVAVREDGADVVFEHRIVPGPSDRSYGIHVARLAGLPAPVVARAEHLLQELEQGRPPSPSRAEAHPTSVQPSFFAEPSAAEAAIAGLDPDALSPLEAIQKLYELRALVSANGRR
ncbi:MAG: DNA mismatch repair protein MutS [Dehalococcoidia bacterium]